MHGYDTYDYGARGLYAAANIMPTIDPLAEKFYSISPYAYCSGNPMKFIDPSGMRQISWDSNIETADMNMPEYNFNSSGVYIGKINTPGENYGRIAGDKKHDPIYFKFADPVEDPKKLEDAGIGNAKVVFEDDEKIQKILNGSGVSDEQNHGLVNGSKYLLSQSNASSLTGGRMDYSGNGKNFIDTSGKTLYMTKTFIDGYVAHNGYNFGNFLWGAGAETLGIPEFMAKIGANINNYLNDPISKGTLDSPDDQFSISVGFNWRYEQRVKKIFNF